MGEYKERMAIEVSKLSKNIFFSIFVFGLLNVLSEFFQTNWLVVTFGVLFVLAFFVSWIAPGILTVLGKPWLTYAWLRGVNPIWYSKKSWYQLTAGTQVGVIIQSIVMSVFASIMLIMMFVNALKK